MENSFLDNTVSSDHNQLAQSSPQARLDSSEVPSDPISDNTNVDETDHEIVSLDPTLDNTNLDETDHEIDPCLCETTSTPNTKSTIVQYNLPPRSNHGQPPAKYEPRTIHYAVLTHRLPAQNRFNPTKHERKG